MIEVATKQRTQPPPKRIVFDALIHPDRDPVRPWLTMHEDEQRPRVLETVEPDLVVWSSIWSWRHDAVIRFDLEGQGSSQTLLRWTLLVDEPPPDDETVVRMRKRLNELVNANLRSTFGQ